MSTLYNNGNSCLSISKMYNTSNAQINRIIRGINYFEYNHLFNHEVHKLNNLLLKCPDLYNIIKNYNENEDIYKIHQRYPDYQYSFIANLCSGRCYKFINHLFNYKKDRYKLKKGKCNIISTGQLSKNKVLIIREHRKNGLKLKEISKIENVTVNEVINITLNRTYKYY